MNAIIEYFTQHETWLMEYIRSHAVERGLMQEAKGHGENWCAPLGSINTALADASHYCDERGCDFPPAGDLEGDPIQRFARDTVQRHRKRKLELATFVRLLGLIREAYGAFIGTDALPEGKRATAQQFVTRFFDRLEISSSMAWERLEEEERRQSAASEKKELVREKERFLTLFESLTKPVIVLDNEWCVETMNSAAADLLGEGSMAGKLRYAFIDESADASVPTSEKVPLEDALPWLSESIGTSCSIEEGERDCRFSAVGLLHDGEHHFDVTVSVMRAESIGFSGLTLVLDDITFRANMERQLADERNRANHYLDIVGSVIVVLDPMANILRINRAGCEVLGYEESDLLGRNWIDIAIPEELRDEVKDYFYMVFSGPEDIESHHINYVTTKEGGHRLLSWNNRLLRNESGVPIGILSSGTDITEQNAMEEQLAEKELWLRNTFVALAEAVLIVSPDGVVIDANPAAEPMFQMTNAELCDLHISELQVDDEHAAEFDSRILVAMKQGETTEFEFAMRRKDGTVFPTENSISRITDDNGTVLGSVFAMRDISRRKRAEQVLMESEEKFRRIFETIGEGFFIATIEGTIQMVNPATCRLLGYEAHELTGQQMEILYGDASDIGRLRKELLGSGTVRNLQISASRKDGSIVIVECNAHLVYDENGAPVAMEGTFRDITERIEAEKVLRHREEQYRAFFENNHAVMLLEDPQTGMLVDANPAAADFYGYPADVMRTMKMSQINALEEEALYKEMFDARDEQRAYFVHKHRLANGEVRDVEVYSGPILVGGRQLLYSVIHDVTKRIRLEREMKRMATTDALTGAANRHQFFIQARQELQRFKRYGNQLSVLMLDIDYFKSINDTYGHQAGDVVLQSLASMAIKTLRESDVFGRLGGEEFAAVLPETSMDAALQVAERLREKLGGIVVHEQGTDIRFTVSIGVTEAVKDDKTIEEALNRADEALYRAKRSGRNRVIKG